MGPVVHFFVSYLYLIFYPLLCAFPDLYYPLVKLGFGIVNYFRRNQSVPRVSDPLLLISATKAAEKIRQNELKSVDLVSAYIRRIKEVNPIVNAMVSDCFDEALAEAKEVDAYIDSADVDSDEWKRLETEKPLFGIPFTVKDSLDVKGKNITVGIVIRHGVISEQDAEVVGKSRAAGGILLGITNVPESLLCVESFNSLFGLTRNPYDTRRSPGGSSGGESALISACGSLIGIGTDLGGSIRIPAFHTGIYGLKPTPGLVSTDGQVPEGLNGAGFKENLFCFGPMTRYIEDVQLCLKAFNPDGYKKLKQEKIENIKILYIESLTTECGAEPVAKAQREKLLEVVQILETDHHLRVHGISFLEMNDAIEMLMTALSDGRPLEEFICRNKGLNLYTEILKAAFGVSDHILHVLLYIVGRNKTRKSAEQKKVVFEKIRRLREKIIAILEEENAVILMPTWPHTAEFHGYTAWSDANIAYTGIWNVLSLPALQCPTGFDQKGLPTGVQVVGPPNSEKRLIEVGTKIDALYGGWKAPWAP